VAEVKIWDWLPGYDFNEEVDPKEFATWLLDLGHSIPRMTPMCAFFWIRGIDHSMKFAAETLSIPTHMGVNFRTKHGQKWFAPAVIRDEQEIKQREAKFREAMRPFIEDFDGLWGKAKDELMGKYRQIRAFDLEKATNAELLQHLDDLSALDRRVWDIHSLHMEAVMMGWVLFEMLCKEWWGLSDSSPEFQKLMSGFDNKMFQVDRGLWQLSQSAMNKGIADVIMTTESGEVVSMLEQTDAGREWVNELRQFLDEDGWRFEHMHILYRPSWIENPAPTVTAIKGYIAKGGDFSLEDVRSKLVREREEAVTAIMERVPAEQKDWFLALLRLAQKAGFYNEEHTYYCENYCHALVRRGLLGIGRRLSRAGTIDQPEDIFFLNPNEVERVIGAPQYNNLRYIVDRRRKEWEKSAGEEPPPVITSRGGIEEAFGMDLIAAGEPIGLKVVAGEIPVVRPELKADLYGVCGSPGVAEGPARVIMSVEQLDQVQPGDILVAPATFPSWTSAFALLAAAVIDRGGALAHAAIVCREYGIPAVINSFEGTKKIKTGQRLRVDGTQGVVYILQ